MAERSGGGVHEQARDLIQKEKEEGSGEELAPASLSGAPDDIRTSHEAPLCNGSITPWQWHPGNQLFHHSELSRNTSHRRCFLKAISECDTVAHTRILSCWEAEAGGLLRPRSSGPDYTTKQVPVS